MRPRMRCTTILPVVGLFAIFAASPAHAQPSEPLPPIQPPAESTADSPIELAPPDFLAPATSPAPPAVPEPSAAVAHPTPARPTSVQVLDAEVMSPAGPVMSSRPPPFTINPQAPAATNDQNFFNGFGQVQDFSRLLPGNFVNTKYKWYGFVRLDGIHDSKPMGSTDDFVTSTIPVPQGRGQNTVLTPRATRLGFDTETPLERLDWTIKTRIELDFFDAETSGAFGSFTPRLRFAWVDFGPFLIGQAATLFMDYDVFPNVVDFEGPGGLVLMRQPLVAVRLPVGSRGKVAFGVEQPYSDIQWFDGTTWVNNPGTGVITTPGVARNVQDLPDFTGNVRFEGDYTHLQLAGIGRKLTFQPASGDSAFDQFGYGINFTGTMHPWGLLTGTPRSGPRATPLAKSRFLGQYAAGRGINRYIQDANGLGLDATYDPINGFRAIPTTGWFVAYEQWWAMKWLSTFTYGRNTMNLTDTLPGNTYQGADYMSANLIWLPVQRMGVGIECLHGYRENKDGQKGDNTRLQMAFQYKF